MAGKLALNGRPKQSLPCIQFSLKTYAGLLKQSLGTASPNAVESAAADC